MAVTSHADGVVRTRQIKPEDRTASARRAGQLPVPAGRIKIQELLLLLLLRSPSLACREDKSCVVPVVDRRLHADADQQMKCMAA
jgi:hypothetical protein